MADLLTIGRRIRHQRGERGLTLDQLGAAIGVAPSRLSLIENGKREPKLSLLDQIAAALGIPVSALLEAEPPSRRDALEIELEHAQSSAAYAELGLPRLRPSRTLPDAALEALVGLHRELSRQAEQAVATPEEARRANTELREWMRERDHCLPEIDELAEEALAAAGHESGALTHREVSLMAQRLGFRLVFVDDLPHSARSVTDLENGRIFLPPASIPGGHGLRSMALQALAHRVLGHRAPASYADFLRQRLEINYYAAACLLPRRQSVEFLRQAKSDHDLAVEDFRDAFGVTHEAAALRLLNLATVHLGIPLHFLRVDDGGAVSKAYENDGLRLPVDVTGSVEGQTVCRHWSARRAFARRERTTEYYQYTDTPEGTFFESTQIGSGTAQQFSITVGVPFDSAKWFRGRDTRERAASRCPDARCCRRPDAALAQRWAASSWSSAKVHAQIFSPLPSGRFPGVDDRELYEFLEAHAAE
jgi:XRE family transcriptional regulator, fatty acid utilization regulator